MKFFGIVGFWEGDEEVAPDVFSPRIKERTYAGDVTRNYRKFQNGEGQNDDLTINNQISILADLYAQLNWHSIRYVLWNGVKWKVNTVEIAYPRLILELGGVWNGENETGVESGSEEGPSWY